MHSAFLELRRSKDHNGQLVIVLPKYHHNSVSQTLGRVRNNHRAEVTVIYYVSASYRVMLRILTNKDIGWLCKGCGHMPVTACR